MDEFRDYMLSFLFPWYLSDNDEAARFGCLSALDDQIAAEGDKLESLKTHKKALLRQLFPSAVSETSD